MDRSASGQQLGWIDSRRWSSSSACSERPGTWARKFPRGFIPTMDQGYAIIVMQLPDGASLARTDAVIKQVWRHRPHRARRRQCRAICRLQRGDVHQCLKFRRRLRPIQILCGTLRKAARTPTRSSASFTGSCRASRKPSSSPFRRHAMRGIGNSGGFKMQISDLENSDMRRVLGLAWQMMGAAQRPRG